MISCYKISYLTDFKIAHGHMITPCVSFSQLITYRIRSTVNTQMHAVRVSETKFINIFTFLLTQYSVNTLCNSLTLCATYFVSAGHVKIHGQPNQQYDCPICSRQFEAMTSLKDHVHQHKVGTRQYVIHITGF